MNTGLGEYETVRRRPIFYQMNHLHLSPKEAWLVFSDLFAISLIFIVVTGLFILRGKNGLQFRGAILVGVGILFPVVVMFLL
jgi:hypothetical protein